MNEVIIHQGSQLAIHNNQADWNEAQAMALFQMFNLGDAPVETLRAYFHTCQTTGLDPFKRQIYLIERQGKWTPQTSIDGFRIIRDRAGVFDGGEIAWCGDDGVWKDVWLLPDPPTAARYVLHRTDQRLPDVATALWSAYVQTKRDGSVTQMWGRMGPHMLAKVAEALAIRMAFPDDTGGLYSDDEMSQGSNEQLEPGETHTSRRRERAPGLQDLMEPPVSQPAQVKPDAPVGGGFMDAGQGSPAAEDPNIEDAVVVPDEPVAPEAHDTAPMALAEPDPAPVVTPAAAAPVQPAAAMDMEPAAEAPLAWAWSARLADFCAGERPQEAALRAMFDEAGAAGALGEPVPWMGDDVLLEQAILTVRDNLQAGRAAW